MTENRKFRLIRRSTVEFFAEARQIPNFSLFDKIHGYFYARWPYFYIAIGTGEHPIAKRLAPLVNWISKHRLRLTTKTRSATITLADTYHGKVVPLAAARQLVQVKQDIQLGDLEKIIPYQRARDLILKNPDHIIALDCPCRVARENPCLPLDVCLIVGEPFAGFIHEHAPDRSRWISQDEAVEILKAEDERGHVHHAFFKDAMLGRFYAICNCCTCCCGAMQAQRNGTPMLASSGYLAVVDQEACTGCGICVDVCQFGALKLDQGCSQVDEAVCMGCGVCVNHCPQGGIELRREESKGIPFEILELMKL